MMAAYTYQNGEIRDSDGTQLLVLLHPNCTKKFRDRVGRTLVGILNAEERGKSVAASQPHRGKERG